MPLVDQIKNYARKIIEDQPDEKTLRRLVRAHKPLAYRFIDDGIVPNHPRWPVLVYRNVMRLDGKAFPATAIDTLFDLNQWGACMISCTTIRGFMKRWAWARGHARVEFGGLNGKALNLKAGDFAILPAGTGHRLLEASRDFLVIGAYPPDGTYDECTDTRDREKTPKVIAKVKKPACDPVYGRNGPLRRLWAR